MAFRPKPVAAPVLPAVILPGNHDCLHPNGIYRRHDFGAACGNVRVITEPDGQAVTLPELDLVVWGRGMETHEPGFHPLAHLPARRDGRCHVAMAHGFFYEDFETPERSSRFWLPRFVNPAGTTSPWAQTRHGQPQSGRRHGLVCRHTRAGLEYAHRGMSFWWNVVRSAALRWPQRITGACGNRL